MPRSIDDVGRTVAADRSAMCDLLAALVSVATENPPGHAYDACLDLLESAVTAVGLDHERVGIASTGAPRAALFAWLGDRGPTLYLHGHYDVVPAITPEQFNPRIEGDALFGRGSSDMKSGLVSMLYAVKAVRDSGVNLRGRV